MNFALFLILLIALIIILISIILYNGLKIELFSRKEKSNFEIEFKASILNIAIFKRQYPSHEDKALETEEENSVKDEESLEDSQEDKSLREKFNEFKPLLNDLKNSKHEIKEFLMSVFKDTDFKELDGYLKLGLGDYAKSGHSMQLQIHSASLCILKEKPHLLKKSLISTFMQSLNSTYCF